MRRIYPEFAYGSGPRDNCWWDETIPAPDWPVAEGAQQVEVAIIGGGFTGISAALHLAESGVDVAVFEAQTPGWGASGRNGGFCCLGGGMLDGGGLVRRYGLDAARSYGASEVAAVDLAAELIARHQIRADTHSKGETIMAHSPKAMATLRKSAEALAKDGQDCTLLERSNLAEAGLQGAFFGALTIPIGFGLNPRKFLFGLAAAAQRAGAVLYQNSPVQGIEPVASGFNLRLGSGTVRAKKLIIATNGYSSEDIPAWLRARYLPSQSSVLGKRCIWPPDCPLNLTTSRPLVCIRTMIGGDNGGTRSLGVQDPDLPVGQKDLAERTQTRGDQAPSGRWHVTWRCRRRAGCPRMPGEKVVGR